MRFDVERFQRRRWKVAQVLGDDDLRSCRYRRRDDMAILWVIRHRWNERRVADHLGSFQDGSESLFEPCSPGVRRHSVFDQVPDNFGEDGIAPMQTVEISAVCSDEGVAQRRLDKHAGIEHYPER